ncbi:MAG: hypothetical protein CMO61_07810 [Verrucomicrobiales bacterium]|nr:hypothetical protein [Verrucomicrobiales bacterium]
MKKQSKERPKRLLQFFLDVRAIILVGSSIRKIITERSNGTMIGLFVKFVFCCDLSKAIPIMNP